MSLVEEWRGPDADEYGRGANAVLTQPVKLSVEDTVVTALEEPATLPVFKEDLVLEDLVLEAEGIQTTPESPSFLSLEGSSPPKPASKPRVQNEEPPAEVDSPTSKQILCQN